MRLAALPSFTAIFYHRAYYLRAVVLYMAGILLPIRTAAPTPPHTHAPCRYGFAPFSFHGARWLATAAKKKENARQLQKRRDMRVGGAGARGAGRRDRHLLICRPYLYLSSFSSYGACVALWFCVFVPVPFSLPAHILPISYPCLPACPACSLPLSRMPAKQKPSAFPPPLSHPRAPSCLHFSVPCKASQHENTFPYPSLCLSFYKMCSMFLSVSFAFSWLNICFYLWFTCAFQQT